MSIVLWHVLLSRIRSINRRGTRGDLLERRKSAYSFLCMAINFITSIFLVHLRLYLKCKKTSSMLVMLTTYDGYNKTEGYLCTILPLYKRM